MAPTRKEVYEKNAWLWVDTCQPLAISDEHVRTAYRINLSRCKIGACRRNCRGNPFCLSNLGEQRWLGSHEDSYSDHIIDPEKERRKPGTYVGLKNLGATCYVNSLLQLWFHNQNFRKAIFKWNPLEDPEEKQNVTITDEKYVPLSVLGHLQAVFAVMRYGERRFVDPTDFILSLRLDTSIQQDAQEFSKLFLSKLETTLSYQPAKEVRDLIKDNFCGEYSYVTRCMRCKMESKRPSTFYELDLNIKGHKTIQDCLREFMNIEMLEGDDKYFCQLCGEKQDAQRFISLTELPPVLNLQLMRFVFDKNTGYKKKLNTFVQFPDKLNMSEFCPNVKGNMEYNLSAVLVHGGRSANSGHYVAHICDSESGTWYKFNDESVEKIEGKKLKLGTEDEYEDGGKKMKIPRAPKGSYHSPNAYMLVYTRSDVVSKSTSLREETTIAAASTSTTDDEWILPSHLRNLVQDQNLQFEKWVNDVQKTNDMAVGRNHHQQLEMATNITLLSIESGYDNLEAVPTSWLTRWLSDPDLDSVIENYKHACCHAKLNPNEVSNVKYINSEMADKLFERYGGEPRFKYSDFLCHDCVIAKCLKIRVKNQIQNEFKVISNKLKTKFCESEIGYWVGKLSLRSWRRMALENLDNGVLDRKRIESLLNNAEMKPGKGTSGVDVVATAAAAAPVTILCKSEENETTCAEPKQMMTATNNRARVPHETTRQCQATNGRTDYEKAGTRVGQGQTEREPKPSPKHRSADDDNAYECQRRCSPRFLVLSKLEECCSVSDANKNDPVLRELCEPLKNVLGRVKNICDEARCEPETTSMTKTSATSTSSVSSYNGAYHNFLQNRDKTLQTSSADDTNAVDERSTKLIEGNGSVFFESGEGGGDGSGNIDNQHSHHHRHYHHHNQYHRRRNRRRGRNDTVFNAEFGCYYDIDKDEDEDVNGGDVEDGDDDDDDDVDYDHECNKNVGGDEDDRNENSGDDDDDDNDNGGGGYNDGGENNEEDEDKVYHLNQQNEMTRRKKPSPGLGRRHLCAPFQRLRHRDNQLRQEATSYGACAVENGGGDDDDYDGKNENNAIQVPAATSTATATTVASLSHRTGDLQTRLNGDGVAAAAFRAKRVVDDEDDSSYAETKFNDDLLCIHGNLCAEENSRKLVPEQVWRVLKKYFPHVNEFTSLSQPCGLCKSIASEAEVAKDMYKTGAVMQKEALGDLYADRCRPQLVYRHVVDVDVENVFYLINKEFITSWRKFIRENGKREPPYSIRNQSWLLCADHSGLLYDLNDPNQQIPNTFVIITRIEWQLLCEAYNADCDIRVECKPDGTVVSDPDVCVPCMRRRIELEEKAQLCYSKAKIYIKIQNDEEVDYLSNEEVTTRPPAAKRAKISSSSSSSQNGNNIINGNYGYLHDMNGGGGGVGKTVDGSNGLDYAFDDGSVEPSHQHQPLATNKWCVNVDDSRSHSSVAPTTTATHRHSASSLTTGTSPAAAASSSSSSSSSCGNEAAHGAVAADSATMATATATAAAASTVTAVRRSSRCRRVRGVKEIIVSSDLTLLDVKKKICEMMSVAPMDQHLFTSDGRSLTENAATLTELSIYPESVLNLKVDEPCESVIADEFIIDREPEAGFKGTGLVGS